MASLTYTQSQNHARSGSVSLGPRFHMRALQIPHVRMHDCAHLRHSWGIPHEVWMLGANYRVASLRFSGIIRGARWYRTSRWPLHLNIGILHAFVSTWPCPANHFDPPGDCSHHSPHVHGQWYLSYLAKRTLRNHWSYLSLSAFDVHIYTAYHNNAGPTPYVSSREFQAVLSHPCSQRSCGFDDSLEMDVIRWTPIHGHAISHLRCVDTTSNANR